MASVAGPAGRAPAGANVAPPEAPALPLPAFQRSMLMLLLMLGTVMQTLDSTIANVALPHIQGSLGATPESVNWVLTSYIVASAVATPVTGWLADRFGRRALLVAALGMFTIASAACAGSTTLPMMVVARLVQGAFGAFILPLGQSLILDLNPRSKHPQAMMVWSLVVLTAPIMGPVFGGWLTDSFDWRWVFLINVPIGIVGVVGLITFMPDHKPGAAPFDLTGFGLLFLAIGAFQLMLDRGTTNDWFESTETIVEAAIAAGGLWAFVMHTLTARAPLMPTIIFRDRNLVIASIFGLVIVGFVLAASAILPPMLQTLLGHDAYGAGLLIAPRGIAMTVSMLIAGNVIKRVDPRAMIIFGLVITAYGVHLMLDFNLDIDSRPVVIAGLFQGFGFGFVSLPMNLQAFATIDPRWRTQAAGLYGLARNLGGSIVIAALTALLVHQQQVSHSDLAAHITAHSIPYAGMPPLGDVPAMAASVADLEVNRQAAMISYLDVYWVMFWAILCCIPLVFLMQPPRRRSAEEAAAEAAEAMAVE